MNEQREGPLGAVASQSREKVTRAIVGIVKGHDVQLVGSGAGLVAAGGDFSVLNGGCGPVLTNGGVTITNGGCGPLIANGDVSIKNGGTQAIIAAGESDDRPTCLRRHRRLTESHRRGGWAGAVELATGGCAWHRRRHRCRTSLPPGSTFAAPFLSQGACYWMLLVTFEGRTLKEATARSRVRAPNSTSPLRR
jgi:hypothetical protein